MDSCLADGVPILGRDDAGSLVKQFLAHYDAPAYVRRARRVQAAYEDLLARCERQRGEWLKIVRMRLGTLRGLVSSWEGPGPCLEPSVLREVHSLHNDLKPGTKVPVRPTKSRRQIQRTFQEFRESVERFNRRWAEYIIRLDLTEVNNLREDFNRYYLIEKECAMRSARLARQGYRRLEPLERAELLTLFPLLPIPS